METRALWRARATSHDDSALLQSARVQPTRQERVRQQARTRALGIGLLVATCAAFLLFFYAGFVSKVLPPTGVSLLDAMRDDWFYCYLVPLVGPTTFIAVYMNWVAMKFFRHN